MPTHETSGRQDQVWDAFRAKAAAEYSSSAFERVAGRHHIRQTFIAWYRTLDRVIESEEQVEDAADDYLEICSVYFSPADSINIQDRGTRSPYMLVHGSLQSIAAYAEALPTIVTARMRVLGSPDPLEIEEAIRWMEIRLNGPHERALVEVSFRFLLRNQASVMGAIAEAANPEGDVLGLLSGLCEKSALARGAGTASVAQCPRTLSFRHQGSVRTYDLLRSTSPEMEALIYWSEQLADRCVGRSVASRPDQPDGFEWAAWLILAGVWPRISIYAALKSKRDEIRGYGEHAHRRQASYIAMNILALDLPPSEVVRSFTELRRSCGANRRGPKLEASSELLCLAALEAKEIDGVGKEDGAAFRKAVLQRYQAKASLHNSDPARYQSVDGWARARRVMRRVERLYREAYPDSRFPVKTRTGSQTLVSAEPDLFSRTREANTYLAPS